MPDTLTRSLKPEYVPPRACSIQAREGAGVCTNGSNGNESCNTGNSVLTECEEGNSASGCWLGNYADGNCAYGKGPGGSCNDGG